MMARCYKRGQNYHLWGVALLAIALMPGCYGNSHSERIATGTNLVKPKIVASYSVLCSLTSQIAEDTINLDCLIGADVDPHAYQPTPADRKAIETAQLIFYGGYDFDASIINLVKATKNSAPKIAVNEQAVPNPLMGEHHDNKEHADEHQGETPDPHIWHDATNGIRMVEVIRDRLAEVAPQNQQIYQQNAQKLISKLQQVDNWIKAQISTIPPQQRKLVTTHDALGYYANTYGIEIEGVLQSFSGEEQPTAARVKEVVKQVKLAGIPTIFAEVTANEKVIGTVAREAKVKISTQKLYTDGLGTKSSPTGNYIGMLTSNTCAIVDGLGGKCTPFSFKLIKQ